VAQRLCVVAHGPTVRMREVIFGDTGHLSDPEAVSPIAGRVTSWRHGPEVACAETAGRLGGPGEVLAGLASCDFGSWTGRSLEEVGADDPDGIRHWLSDPRAAPHGGESLAELIARVGSAVTVTPWPDGQSVVVVVPLVARAMIAYALGAPAEVIFRIDVPPLGRVALSRRRSSWRVKFGASGEP
jgi:broad specificity phosphatase PhoE